MTNIGPLEETVLPAEVRFLVRRRRQRPHDARAGGGVRDHGPAVCAPPATGFRQPRLFLAQDHAEPEAAGFYVIAPDQRGYGRTTGWDGSDQGHLHSFQMLNLVRDALALVSVLGYRSVAAVVGHDFGSPVAAYCAIARPDVFRSVALMSAPFAGPPAPGGTAGSYPSSEPTILDALAALDRPRKHYQWDHSSAPGQ